MVANTFLAMDKPGFVMCVGIGGDVVNL